MCRNFPNPGKFYYKTKVCKMSIETKTSFQMFGTTAGFFEMRQIFLVAEAAANINNINKTQNCHSKLSLRCGMPNVSIGLTNRSIETTDINISYKFSLFKSLWLFHVRKVQKGKILRNTETIWSTFITSILENVCNCISNCYGTSANHKYYIYVA